MLEWITHLEQAIPQAVGFGRIVGLNYQYWHTVNRCEAIKETELLKTAAETLKVARMYSVNTDRVKFTGSDHAVYLLAPGEGALCLVLARAHDIEEANVWTILEKTQGLVPVE